MGSETKTRFLSEGILIACTPALAYLIAYTFKSSYFGYYDIPRTFISIDVSDIIFSCTSVILCMGLCFGVSLIMKSSLENEIPKHFHTSILPTIPMFVYCLIFFLLRSYTMAFILFIISLYALVIDFIRATKVEGATYSEKYKNFMDEENKRIWNPLDVFSNHNKKYLYLFQATILCYAFATPAGSYAAKVTQNYSHFSYKNNDYIVIDRFGDNFVAKEIDVNSKTFKKGYAIVPMANLTFNNIKEKITF